MDNDLQFLADEGHRITVPRRAVWQALHVVDGHVTAEELTDVVQDLEPGVNLASVYRSLALFSDLGLVRESRLGSQEAARWELAHPDEHFHLVCESCGSVDHHVGTLVEQVRHHLDEGHGFQVSGVELIVTGTCVACRG